MYSNFQDNPKYGFALNKLIVKDLSTELFINHENKNLIKYAVDTDNFLRSLYNYKDQKYIIKIFGGSTSFCSRINQKDLYIERTFFGLNKKKLFYKNYAIPGHNILNDYFKLKNFAKNSFSNSESIFLFNHGWNEEFVNSICPEISRSLRPLNVIESNFIYQKNLKLSKLCKNKHLAKSIKKKTDKQFVEKMNFYGLKRWNNLINNNYVNFWLKNLEKIFNLIHNHKVIICNNPGLANLSDNNSIVDEILESSRLNKPYHLYQSICLEINSIVNKNISEHFGLPLIDLNDHFKKLKINKKINFFYDEIHFTRSGHDYLYKVFKKKFNKISLNKMNKIKSTNFKKLKNKIFNDIDFLLDIAKRQLYKNHNASKKIYFIPKDRYPVYKF